MKIHIKLIPSIIFFLGIQIQLYSQLTNERDIPYQWTKTDTAKHIVELSEFKVVLPRGAFPTIDFPEFIGKKQGLELFFRHEPVISIEIEDQAKAYPLNMLTMHEISNDTLGGIPILPTYCPLCNASVVYDRRFESGGKVQTLTFEVSGMLRNSDMVMADQQTESWWQQLNGKALVGEFAGEELNVLPSQVISVKDFFDRYPNGQILSPKTEQSDRYGKNPYVGYDSKSGKPYERFFNHEKIDRRLAPMERLIDLEVDEKIKVYPFSEIAKAGVINDEFEGEKVVIFYEEKTVSVLDQKEISNSKSIGSAALFSSELSGKHLIFEKRGDSFFDQKTGSKWDITGRCIEGKYQGKKLLPLIHSNHFAFAFLTFYPDVEIYRAP